MQGKSQLASLIERRHHLMVVKHTAANVNVRPCFLTCLRLFHQLWCHRDNHFILSRSIFCAIVKRSQPQIGLHMKTNDKTTVTYVRWVFVNLLMYASPPVNSMPIEVNEKLTGPSS